MKVLDLFSGIGGFSLAMHEAGFETVAFSEIEPFPSRVLANRFDAPNLGDVTKINPREIRERFGRVDVICGGFPCQDLSVAGKRTGLGGGRSGLFWEIVGLARGLQPAWLVLENVPGLLSSWSPVEPPPYEVEPRTFDSREEAERWAGGVRDDHDVEEANDLETVVAALEELGYGVAWRVLDAQHFGVPQRRRRVFVVGRLGRPCPPEILFEPEGLSGDLEASGEEGTRVAAPLTAGSGSGRNRAGRRREDDVNIVAALTADGVGTCGADDNQAQAGHFVAVPLTTKPYADNEAQESRLVYACQGSNVGEFGTLKSGNGGVTGGIPFTMGASVGQTNRGTPTGETSETLRAESHGALPMVAHALTGEGFDASEDGTGRGTPIVPFDTTQITSDKNYSHPRAGDPCHPLAAGAHAPAIAYPLQDGKDRAVGPKGLGIGSENDPAYTLNLSGEAAVAFALRGREDGAQPELSVEHASALRNASGGSSRDYVASRGVRRLTPTECERLQGFPDGWSDIEGASDSARYRALGNAIAVPVVEWIGRNLARESRRERKGRKA